MTLFIAEPISKDYGFVDMSPFVVSLAVICLVYKAYLNSCRHEYTSLPRLRPLPARGHWLYRLFAMHILSPSNAYSTTLADSRQHCLLSMYVSH